MRDDELCAALATDLNAAFEELVTAYQHRLYALALRLSGDTRDAEEIAQDTFVRAYRALAGYPAARVRALALRSWLYRIMLNVLRNRVRVRRPPSLPLDAPDEGGAPLEIAGDAREWPEVAVEAAERRRELAGLVAALPEHFRVAVVLRHVEGLTYREIASLLDEPDGTVKAHVHRGVCLLREGLVAQARREV